MSQLSFQLPPHFGAFFFTCFLILFIALLLAIFISGFSWSHLWQCLPFSWFLFVWFLLHFVALISYCLVLLVCLVQTSIQSTSLLHSGIGLGLILLLFLVFHSIFFRELLRKKNSSQLSFCFLLLCFWRISFYFGSPCLF